MLESSTQHPPLRALLLSLAACAIPVAGAIWMPYVLQDYEALLWLVALVPAFLLAYYKGWRGAATSAAGGMAVISITYAIMQTVGRPVPDLLPAVVFIFIIIALAAGGLAERLRYDAGTALATERSFTDATTDLPNRAHAELHLDIEFSAAQRGHPLAIVVLDLDNFKGYNARHGDIAGDEMLRILGEVLKRTTRRMNLAARFGEDEFLCILGGCDDEGAVAFVNRLQEALRAVAGQRPLPSISGGVASYGPSIRTHHDLLAAAESALRQAKKEGRGRVRVYGRAINLPLTIGEASEDTNALVLSEPAAEPPMPSARGAGRKALVVAENASVRASLARLLTDHGFTVARVSNVVDGVQCLTTEYDLLFTDISLSQGFGTELVRAAKLRWPFIQVLGIVQEQDGDLQIETLNAGVDRFLVTPLDLAKVRQHITELLARRDRVVTSVLDSRQLTMEFKARTDDAVDALRHTEQEYRTDVATLHEVIFRADTNGVLTSLNGAWTEATQQAAQHAVGRKMLDYVHEEDRAEFGAILQAVIAGERTDAHAEVRMVRDNGETRWFDLRMRTVFDERSRIVGVAGVFDDVTPRKHAEDALRLSEEASRGLLAALPDDVYRISKEGVILSYDGNGQPQASTSDLVGGSLEHAFPPPAAAALRERLQQVLATGQVRIYEYRLLDDEEPREYEVRLAPSGGTDVVAIVRNVTDKKLLEEQLRQAQKLEAIGRLAGGLAHDFNNLLTVVQGNAQLLAEERVPDSARDFIHQIEQAAQRGASLVKQLLAFGRRQVLLPTILNLNAVIESTRSMAARLIGENIQLEVDLDPSLGLVKADPGQIEQILVNLVVNARDAMPNGGHLSIRTRNAVMALHGDAQDDEHLVLLTISDNGAGMDAGTRERIFEPFFTTKAFGQASGLGLATVYGIVQQSGGTISVNSEPDRGTTFEISFPRIDA